MCDYLPPVRPALLNPSHSTDVVTLDHILSVLCTVNILTDTSGTVSLSLLPESRFLGLMDVE